MAGSKCADMLVWDLDSEPKAKGCQNDTFASKARTYSILIFLLLTTSLSGEIDEQLASTLVFWIYKSSFDPLFLFPFLEL